MNTQKKINRFTVVALAVALVVCLVVGSASALTITHQKVSMSDPYAVMPLTLNPEDSTRTLKTYGSYSYGANSPTSYRRTVSSFTTTSSSTVFNGDPDGWYTPGSSSSKGTYLRVPSGFYVDITAPVSFPNTEYGSVLFSGGGSFMIENSPYASNFVDVYAYPDTVQILVNGVLVGDPITCTSTGSFTLNDIEVAITDTVTSIGLRFKWTSADTVSNSTGSLTSMTYRSYFRFSDTTSITPVDIADIDYIPYFNRVIAWLQSIYGNTNVANSLLESINQSLDGQSSSDSPLGRLANVFARDDDIQLRDDMDETLKEATSIFYDSTENPSTAISTDTISSAGETLQGVSSMFDSGFEATDVFQEIADSKDDFMSWFTEDTYSWLDTVPSTYTREDDPYNTWMIENQYAEMAKRRGE